MSRLEVYGASFILWETLRGLECHLCEYRRWALVPLRGRWRYVDMDQYRKGLGCFEVSHSCVDRIASSPESKEVFDVELPQVGEDEEVWLLKEGDGSWHPIIMKKKKEED